MSTLRVVSYAINGRGMGHLVRQLAILRWVKRITAFLDQKCECWIITSSEADTLARREGICAFKMPSKAMMRDAGIEPARHLSVARAWTLNIISGLSPDLLVVDTFPGGSFGELIAPLEMVPKRVLVARRVREQIAADAAYASLVPLYDATLIPDDGGTGPIMIREREELMPRADARKALGVEGDRKVVYVTFGGGGDAAAAETLPRLVAQLTSQDVHVVVGAGPLYDGPECRGPGITWMSRYVPMELFLGFDAAVSAGGYNSYHELMYCGVPAVFTPQPRISDDQEERVHRAAAAGAGLVAQSLDDVAGLLMKLLQNPDASECARALVPRNGAREAAMALLGTVLPARDVDMAQRVLTPSLFGAVASAQLDPRQMLEVVRILSGGTPTEIATRRALLAELSDRGVNVDRIASDLKPNQRVERFLATVRDCGVPLVHGVSLLRALRKKFPAATGAVLTDAVEQLFPVWSRFQDWMGAVSLMRAVPTQRSYGLAPFSVALASWLPHEEDLFDALRSFSQLEGGGVRPVAEVLRLLARQSDEALGSASDGSATRVVQ